MTPSHHLLVDLLREALVQLLPVNHFFLSNGIGKGVHYNLTTDTNGQA